MQKNTVKEKIARVKSVNVDSRTVSAYVSTSEWDRYDERFSRGAWVLDDFKKNPVVMWAHDYKAPPIGKAIEINEDDGGLFSKTLFDEKSERAMHIFSLYERGFLNAFSVGFEPKEWTIENIDHVKKGIVHTRSNLLEYSAVPIPANPGALVPRGVAELCEKIGVKGIIKVGDEYRWDSPAHPSNSLKKLDVKSLEHINQMARTVKGNPIEANMISLMRTTIDTFQEIINENTDEVSKKEVEILREQVYALAELVKGMNPDAEDVVAEVMRTIDAGVSKL